MGLITMTFVLCMLMTFSVMEDGNFGSSGFGEDQFTDEPVDVYDVTELARWSIPAGDQALGLDYMGYWYVNNVVGYVDNVNNTLYWMDTNTGSSVGTSWATDANNGSPFGLAHVPITGDDDEVHVNDFAYDGVFFKEWDTSWTEYNALCDNMGRGMDYCEDMDKIFELYTVADPGAYKWYVAMYTPGTSTGTTYELDCNIGSDWRGSGVTLFPQLGGDMAIAVTMYSSAWIRFFEYPGNPGGIYYGYCVLPYSGDISSSYGLTYSDDQDCFYHAWTDGTNYYISQLEVTEVTLEQSTWGQIKSSF